MASRPAVDQGLPQALADLTNAKKPLGGKHLRQRLHRLGRKIEDAVLTFKGIARDAQLEGGAAATATATKKGPRPRNAERRRRKWQQGQLEMNDNSYRGLLKEQREWVAVVGKNKKKNARQRRRTECPAMAAQGRTGERGRDRAQARRSEQQHHLT